MSHFLIEGRRELSGVFTPAGKNEWNVAFHFVWEDEPHVYTGTAKGNLKSGDLEGEVESDSEETSPMKLR